MVAAVVDVVVEARSVVDTTDDVEVDVDDDVDEVATAVIDGAIGAMDVVGPVAAVDVQATAIDVTTVASAIPATSRRNFTRRE